jgi:predicted ester cyclase
MILAVRTAFPDLKLELHDIFGADDKVVSRWTLSGTHAGNFLGIAPTGNTVRFDGIAIDLFRDGVRVDGWAQFDKLGLLRQLGAIDDDGPFA